MMALSLHNHTHDELMYPVVMICVYEIEKSEVNG